MTVCIECSSQKLQIIGNAKFGTLNKENIHELDLISRYKDSIYYRCLDCCLGFRLPVLTHKDLNNLYENIPPNRWCNSPVNNIAWDIALKYLTSFKDNYLSILDVGTYDGSFLNNLPDNWEKSAIEPSEAQNEYLRKHNIKIVAKFLNSPSVDHTQYYDIVTMFDVFEHLTTPKLSIEHALKYLKPGGRLILSTGNLDHITFRLLGSDHWYLQTIQHVSIGSIKYFNYIAKELNLDIEKISLHSHKYQSFYQYIDQVLLVLSYSGSKSSNPFLKVISKILFHTPGLSYLKHKTNAPYAPNLKDHLLIILRKN